MNANELAKELGYYLKKVVSIDLYDYYDASHNIFSQFEEAVRRIVVLTPFEDLEEVYEVKLEGEFKKIKLSFGNVWIREYPLLTSLESIDLENIILSNEEVQEIKKMLNKI